MIQKISDSVIDEIHRTREKISDLFDGNINAIAEDAARRQAESGRRVWKSKAPNNANSADRYSRYRSFRVG